MNQEEIEYVFWKTGEKIKKKLNDSHPAEEKTNLICPFDETPIIRWYNEIDQGYKCPNCGTNYSGIRNRQEDVNKYAEKHFNQLQEKLIELEKDKKDLEKKVNHAIGKRIIREDLFSKFRGTSLFPDKKGKE